MAKSKKIMLIRHAEKPDGNIRVFALFSRLYFVRSQSLT